MHMRLTMTMVTLGAGCALALATTAGCSSSQPSSGLWSCFDTGTQTACTQVSGLSTADRDVNGDGVPDHFVCADDDDGLTSPTSLTTTSGHDADHDGVDDDLDCDARRECESLSDDANPDRHGGGGEVETEHDGGVEDHDGGHHGDDSSGGGGSGGGGVEMHDDHTCTAPKLTP